MRFALTAGQKGDAPQAAALIEGLPAEVVMADTVRIPVKATMLSGAWRPRDPVDDDQGGARAWWHRWSYFLISVFAVRVKQ